MAALDAHRAYDRYGPYLLPRIKGTFALHQLRLLLGNEGFLHVMRAVHDRFAEREMSTADFIAVGEEVSGTPLGAFIRQWLEREGLPELKPTFEVKERKGGWEVRLEIEQDGDPYRLVTHMEVTAGGERHLERIEIDGRTEVKFHYAARPTRIVFNALDDIVVPRRNFYVWRNFIDDFHSTLIVYATASQIEANHTLGRRWQQLVADTYVEILPPLVKDAEINQAEAESHDLMVIGTGNDNYFFDGLAGAGIEIGRGTFNFRGGQYVDPRDGLFAVLPNPFNPEKVLYLIVGNSAKELYEMTTAYHREIPSWAVFKGSEIVEQGFFEPEGYVIDLKVDEF
jgi:hypothetical protein